MRNSRRRIANGTGKDRKVWDLIYDSGLAVSFGHGRGFSVPLGGKRVQVSPGDAEPNPALQYNRARCHDPRIGRWLTQDPLGCDAGETDRDPYWTAGQADAAR